MKNNNNNNKKKNMKLVYLIIAIVLIIWSLLMLCYRQYLAKSMVKEKDVAYTDLIKDINEGKIEKIKLTTGSNSILIVYKNADDIRIDEKAKEIKISPIVEVIGKKVDQILTNVSNNFEKDEEQIDEALRTKTVILPNIQAFVELVQEKIDKNEVDLELIQNPESTFILISERFFSLLPTVLLIVLMLMVFKMQGLGGDSNGKVYGGEENKTTNVKFDDVAGLDEEKNELVEIVDFLKKPDEYIKMGAKIPRGILLYGKPGTGKTLIAKAIAGEAGVPFISMSGSEFIEMFAGLGASRVRRLFQKAKKMSPCIIFIDEIDAIGSRRTSNSGAETENNQTLNQLLVEMDGFETNETVIVLAATNRPEMLDKALLRPGRFDRQITIPTPDLLGRKEILELHSKDKRLDEDIDLKEIAGDTAGFTGAELSNLLNEAAIIATRLGHSKITKMDLENAVRKITVGLEKHNRVISDKDKKLTAYHEAGHAIVSKFLPTQEDVKEVSIIPRGVAGGYTMYKTTEDKFYRSRTELKEQMVALMGGRAAEKIALNEISTGASNDIEVATNIAKDMLTVYGMSDALGPISLKVNEPYEMQIFGEKIVDEAGEEIKQLIDEAYISAQKILLDHMDILDRIALTLIEKEKITEEEFNSFF